MSTRRRAERRLEIYGSRVKVAAHSVLQDDSPITLHRRKHSRGTTVKPAAGYGVKMASRVGRPTSLYSACLLRVGHKFDKADLWGAPPRPGNRKFDSGTLD